MTAPRKQLAVIGIGNTIAGDDGVGVEIVRSLERICAPDEQVFFATLEGDLFAVAGLLDCAERFVFVDALPGERPGSIVIGGKGGRCYAPSFHQTDIGSVMESLRILGAAEPFPKWEIWGVTIDPPRELKTGLSPAVEAAARKLTKWLAGICRASSAGDN